MAATIIDIRSLSYTGTTWVNLLAGSHPDVFTCVVPHRIFQALRGELDPDKLCLVHGARCDFWPAAVREMNLDENVYHQITALSGCAYIALNNPFVDPQGVADLEGCVTHKVTVVRDGRATVASYLGRHDATVSEAISWLSGNASLAEAAPGERSLRVRYEDIVRDQRGFLHRLGEFVGLQYGDQASAYWTSDHHPTGGNPGPFALLRRHLSGRPAADPLVETRYQRVIADPLDTVNDEKWRKVLTTADLELFEQQAGNVNTGWGYTT